jgi:biotin carboxylase
VEFVDHSRSFAAAFNSVGMSKTTLLFIGAGRHQSSAIARARDLGHRVVACDQDPNADGFRYAHRKFVFDIKDEEQCRRIASECAADAVLTIAAEVGVRGAAYAAEQLGLIGIPYRAALDATDKLRMRRAFEVEGVPSTAYRGCSDAEEALDAYRALGPRVVVKPAIGAGSRGVTLVDSELELLPAVEAAQRIARGAFLVESFMPGTETAVEAFMIDECFELLCVSDKVRTKSPYLLDLSVTFPSARPSIECSSIVDVAKKAARALGLRDTPLHIEIMMTPDGPKVVELAARGGGFNVFTKIVPWVTNVDVVRTQIDLALGQKPKIEITNLRSAILDFPVFGPGVITAIDGLEELDRMEGMLFWEVFHRPGDRVGVLRSGADRVVALGVRGDNLADALNALQEAHSHLKIAIEPD